MSILFILLPVVIICLLIWWRVLVQSRLDTEAHRVKSTTNKQGAVYKAAMASRVEFAIDPALSPILRLMQFGISPNPLGCAAFDAAHVIRCDNARVRDILRSSAPIQAALTKLWALEPSSRIYCRRQTLTMNSCAARGTLFSVDKTPREPRQLALRELSDALDAAFSLKDDLSDPGLSRTRLVYVAVSMLAVPFLLEAVRGGSNHFVGASPWAHWWLGLLISGLFLLASRLFLAGSSHAGMVWLVCAPLTFGLGLASSQPTGDFLGRAMARKSQVSEAVFDRINAKRSGKNTIYMATFHPGIQGVNGEIYNAMALSRTTLSDLSLARQGSTLLVTHGLGLSGEPTILDVNIKGSVPVK